ncbi:MAG: GrdX family protein [Clostridium sp.]
MMKYIIVSNNPQTKGKVKNLRFIDGTMRDVLVEARDLVQGGSELITHPLGASLRMLLSPYRSIVMVEKEADINFNHLEAIENSIIKYDQHMGVRREDTDHSKDYAIIDFKLLESAFNEMSKDVKSEFF